MILCVNKKGYSSNRNANHVLMKFVHVIMTNEYKLNLETNV